MKKYKIIYVYDAHCSWCFAFSDVIKQLEEKFHDQLDFEIISGGMIVGESIGDVSKRIDTNQLLTIYQRIMDMTGAQFGEKYLEKIRSKNVYANSEIPAIALSVFKSYNESKAIEFAHRLQSKMFQEALAVNDDNLYSSIAEEFSIDGAEFLAKMKEPAYEQAARYDFALSRQLQVTGYPQVLVQTDETKFYLIARGYTDFETLSDRVQSVLG